MPRRALLLTAGGLAMVLAASLASTATADQSDASNGRTPLAYALLAPASQSASGLIVRAVLAPQGTCPTLQTTDTATGTPVSTPLTVRPAPANTRSYFSDVQVCEVIVPAGAASPGTVVFTDGTTLSVPAAVAPIEQLAIIGDTGCRIVYNIEQDCNSPVRWPLARFASRIAEAAPQAVIHVGDYFYGQVACRRVDWCGRNPKPARDVPFVDTAASFAYQFLEPMRPVYSVAPILPIRGSQEICTVDGISYFYFLDPHLGTSQTCAPVRRDGRLVAPIRIQDAYAIDLPLANGATLRTVMVDSAQADDQAVTFWSVRNRPGFEAGRVLAADPAVDSWLLTHRPLFGIRPNWQCGFVCTPFSRKPRASMWVSSDIAAAGQGELRNYRMILSGHVHLTEGVQVPGQPGQLITGAGGTVLDPRVGFTTPRYGQLADGLGRPMSTKHTPYPRVSRWFRDVRFAYALATPTSEPGGWSFRFLDVRDDVTARCTLSGREITCRP